MSSIKQINHNQYFTPEQIAAITLSYISRYKIKNVIDPAVGEGVFLNEAFKRWTKANFYGIDIDRNIIGKLNKNKKPKHYYYCGDSTNNKTLQNLRIKKVLDSGGFDLTVGNPPFSSKSNLINCKEILENYEITKHKDAFKSSQAIEIIFLQIFFNLTKNDGIIVIVLPDGILSNPRYKFVRDYIISNSFILKIIDLPRNVFEKTSAKASVLILKKLKKRTLNYNVSISCAEKNGDVNNTIKVNIKLLKNRMDYYFHYKKRNSSINDLNRERFTVLKLKDFIKVANTGNTYYGKDRKFNRTGLKFIHSTNLNGLGFNYENGVKYIRPDSKMYFENSLTRVRDLIFARVGNGCIGKAGIILKRNERGVISDCLYRLRVFKSSPYFILLYLKSKFAQDWIDIQKHGIASSCITLKQLLSLPVPVLHKNTENNFSKKFKKILKRQRNCNSENIEKKIYKDFYLLKNFLEKKLTSNV